MPMAAVEGAGHIVRYVNPAFGLLLGKTRKELIGNAFSGIVPTENECLSLLDRVYQTGRAEIHTGQEESAARPLYWSYAMWPVLAADSRIAGVMFQVTETTPFHQQAITMNQALMVASVRQHELTEAAETLNEQLERANEGLKRLAFAARASVVERDVLLREVHHRVKNNLQVIVSLLNLQSHQITEPALRGAFQETQNRVRAIAGIHETLYRFADMARIDFSAYLQQLVRDLFSVYGVEDERIRPIMKLEDVVLEITQAVPLGLILNELVTNCLKYAFPNGRSGQVGVELSYREEGWAQLRVWDDGQGLPADFDERQIQSMGMTLVRILTGQMNGRLHVQGTGGTEFRIDFPLAVHSGEAA